MAIFVLHLADDLVRLDVDDIARGGISELAIQAEGNPEGASGGVDGVDLLWIFGIGEDVDLFEDAIGQPDLAFIRRQRNTMARTAVGDAWTRICIPLRPPILARHLDRLNDLARGDVRDQKAQEIVLVGVNFARVLVQYEYANVIGEGDRLDDLARLYVR